MDIWEKFIPCDCGSEGIMVSHERDEENGLPLIDFAYFTEGHDGRTLTLRQRLKWCWRILITGKPWTDMVTLNQKSARELGKHLTSWSRKKYGRKVTCI